MTTETTTETPNLLSMSLHNAMWRLAKAGRRDVIAELTLRAAERVLHLVRDEERDLATVEVDLARRVMRGEITVDDAINSVEHGRAWPAVERARVRAGGDLDSVYHCAAPGRRAAAQWHALAACAAAPGSGSPAIPTYTVDCGVVHARDAHAEAAFAAVLDAAQKVTMATLDAARQASGAARAAECAAQHADLAELLGA